MTPPARAERYAAYCVRHGITPAQLTRWRNDPAVVEHYEWVQRVWTHWHHMEGTNVPLKRHVFGERDYDINIDGAAQDIAGAVLSSQALPTPSRSSSA